MKKIFTQDKDLLVVNGKRTIKSFIKISGSKHAALHLTGIIPLLRGKIVIKDYPNISDTKKMLEIYSSMGMKVKWTKNGVEIENNDFFYNEELLYKAKELRSSVLLLGNLLILNKYVQLPKPGGDKINKTGSGKTRNLKEFISLLKLFNVDVAEDENFITAKIDGNLHGNFTIDLADKNIFDYASGNNRTALAIILAVGNVGTTIIKHPLKVAEIDSLIDLLKEIKVNISYDHEEDLITIVGNGPINLTKTHNATIIPDKCEIVFWIIYAHLVGKEVKIKFNSVFKKYNLDNFGPLFRVNETIFKKINIEIKQIGDNEFLINGKNKNLNPYQLILDHLETEYDGRVMDASPYYIPLFTQINGESSYLDDKFGSSRSEFVCEMNKLCAKASIDDNEVAHVFGKTKLDGLHKVLKADEIRGAGALLLSLLAIKKTNFLMGANSIYRGNNYISKLIANDVDIKFGYKAGRDELANLKLCDVREIVFIAERKFAAILKDDEIIIFTDVSFKEIFFASFLNKRRMGAQKLYTISENIEACSPERLRLLDNKDSVSVSSLSDHEKQKTFIVKVDKSKINKPADLDEFIGVNVGNEKFFASRCISPLKYSVFLNQIKKIIKNPDVKLAPLLVSIGITHGCNYSCSFCYAADMKNGKMIKRDKLLSLIEDFSDMGVKVLRYIGNGEASTHPSFIESLLLAKASGMGTFIITNGSMTQSYSRLFAACFDFIRVSLNTIDPDQYVKVHGVNSKMFDLVKQGLKNINDYKKSLNKRLITGISYVLDETNYKQIPEMVRISKKLGANFILLKENHFNKLSAEKMSEIKTVLKELLEKYSNGDFRFVPEIFKYNVDGLDPDYYKGSAGCLITNTRCIIDANGDVMSCGQRGKKCYAEWGNLNNQTFKSIIFGKIRTDADNRRAKQSKVCDLCLFKDTHLAIGKSLENL